MVFEVQVPVNPRDLIELTRTTMDTQPSSSSGMDPRRVEVLKAYREVSDQHILLLSLYLVQKMRNHETISESLKSRMPLF